MPRRALLLALTLLVLTRAALVIGVADVFFYGEELAKGAAAKAMLDGLPVEHWKKAYVYHEGGGFVVTHLKALLFVLVGESVLAHKLAAVLVASLVLAAGFRFAALAFGERAAALFALLFVLAPSAFLRFSLLSLGTHFEALLFVALVLHATLRAAERDPPRRRDWLSLGLAAGFGLWFSLQALPAIAASGAYLLVYARDRLRPRPIALALAGFAAGAAPLAWFLSKAGLDALRVRGDALAPAQGTGALDAFLGLFAPLAHGDAFDWIAVALYPAVIAAGFAVRPRAERPSGRRGAVLVLLLLGAFLAAYVASGLAIESRGMWTFFWRLSTVWLAATLLFAAGAARLLEHGSRVARALALGAIALLALAGLDDLRGLLLTGRPTIAANARWLADTKGYEYVEYLDKFKTHLDGDERAKIEVLRAFDDDPSLLAPSIAHSLFDRSQRTVPEVVELVRASFGGDAGEALKGLGPFLAPDGRFDVPAAFERLAEAPPDAHAALAEAIGRTGRGLKVTDERVALELAGEGVPAELREPFWRGTGWRLQHFHRQEPSRALATIEAAEEPARSAARAGFEAAQRARSLSGSTRAGG